MQSFFPISKSSPNVPQLHTQEEDNAELADAEKLVGAKGVDAQVHYVENKDRLMGAMYDSVDLLADLRRFNKESWVVRYPTISAASQNLSPSDANSKPRKVTARRSLSFMDDPTTQVPVEVVQRPGSLRRSMTIAPVMDPLSEDPATEKPQPKDDSEDAQLLPTEFNVLRLDLTLGPQGSSASPSALIAQLEKASIANLLDERIAASLAHIEKLIARIGDISSKVLVTGDLNAGKSTFVNALLQRDVLPVDQQPCTTMFLEVHPASDNDGKEEVHVVKPGATYNRADESTFTRTEISELATIATEEQPPSHTLKLYVNDPRPPSNSLLQNGVVDISLVDAPGLNHDSVHTTALFARQEEIDVIVFVVSATDHFTQSAKEFLFNASKEKAYVFIVVNKFDSIKDKAKCKTRVLNQIKSLSPLTWNDAENLVHFVDSASAIHNAVTPDAPRTTSVPSETFDNLEDSLRSFVLVKRAKSKLLPASTYLCNLLSDLSLLAGTNSILAQKEIAQAEEDIKRLQPILDQMKEGEGSLADSLDAEEEATAGLAMSRAQKILEIAVERVGKGEVGVSLDQLSNLKHPYPLPKLPTYPGLLGVWTYTKEVKEVLLTSLDVAAKIAQDEARALTSASVDNVAKIGDTHLPPDVRRPERVFVPDAMFARAGKGKRHSTIVAGGAYNLGIGLAQRSDMLEISFQDIFDINHHVSSYFGGSEDQEEGDSHWGLQVAGAALTGLTVVGGKTMGLRAFIDTIGTVSDVLSNETSRRWVAPVLAACTLGLGVYVVTELPYSIPRTVGRQIRSKLNNAPTESASILLTNPELSFIAFNVQQIGKETRKVVKLASFDLRESYRGAVQARTKEKELAEENYRRAKLAGDYFGHVLIRVEGLMVKAELVVV